MNENRTVAAFMIAASRGSCRTATAPSVCRQLANRSIENQQQQAGDAGHHSRQREELRGGQVAPQSAKRARNQISHEAGAEPERDGGGAESAGRETSEEPESDGQDVELARGHHEKERRQP